ncbi:MAG: undecaprenyldiphospho-muramoylpentapeptide beta-N-acetylglucosaminyltransferase [Clostridia bacterium]
MKVLIAAAGTGGHVNPGIAIANKIKEKEKDAEIVFVGTTRGLENDLVPRAGYPLKTIDVYGIRRSLSIENIKRAYKMLTAMQEAKRLVKEFKPDVVIGTGGYVCVPVGLASKKYQIPLVLHESNAFPGMAVKLLSKKADKILLGFEEAKQRLPKAKEVVVTGTPTKVTKLSMTKMEKEEIRKRLGFTKDLPLVLAFGGSQGAKSINESLIEIIQKEMNQHYNLLWATGASAYDEIKEVLERENRSLESRNTVKIVPYIYNMEEMLNAVDVIISRSGAMSITEISTVGKPAIFIPFPYAAENHQEYNARVLEKAKAAKVILDKALTATYLNQEVEELIKNPQKMENMGINARKIAIDHVEDKIYEEIKKVVP